MTLFFALVLATQHFVCGTAAPSERCVLGFWEYFQTIVVTAPSVYSAHIPSPAEISPMCHLHTFILRERNSEKFEPGNPSLCVSHLPDATSVYRCV